MLLLHTILIILHNIFIIGIITIVLSFRCIERRLIDVKFYPLAFCLFNSLTSVISISKWNTWGHWVCSWWWSTENFNLSSKVERVQIEHRDRNWKVSFSVPDWFRDNLEVSLDIGKATVWRGRVDWTLGWIFCRCEHVALKNFIFNVFWIFLNMF